MKLSRHCYDKPWRCPGWAGAGWHYARPATCDGGSLMLSMTNNGFMMRRGWSLRSYRCVTCGLRTIPYVTRWFDPSWLTWCARERMDKIRDWWQDR